MKLIAAILLTIAFFGIIIGGSFLFESPKTILFESPKTIKQTDHSKTVLIVAVNPCLLAEAFAVASDYAIEVDIQSALQEFIVQTLTKDAKNIVGLDIRVHVVGGIVNTDDGQSYYQNVVVELTNHDSFDAIQHLILIDYVTYIGDGKHHALKKIDRLEIK